MESGALDALIGRLDHTVSQIGFGRPQWKPTWNLIREIGEAFKEVHYPSVEDKNFAWTRFQSLVARVKSVQEADQKDFDKRSEVSRQHKKDILSHARAATPPSGINEMIGAVIVGPLEAGVRAVLDAVIPGPRTDPVKEALEDRSRELDEGWRLLTEWKDEMLGRDKTEAFEALTAARDRLRPAWDEWRAAQKQAFEGRQQARQEREERRAAWEERLRNRIERLERRVVNLTEILAKKESHLEELLEKRDTARSDDFRAIVEGWIAKEESEIRDFRNTLREVEEDLAETRNKIP